MIIRNKPVTYSNHVINKLFKVDHLEIVNNILKTGKWKKLKRRGLNKVVSPNGIVLIVRELPDRFKVITIGGEYEKIYKM